MFSDRRESSGDSDQARERLGRRRDQRHALTGPNIRFTSHQSFEPTANSTETPSRLSTPELYILDATSSVPNADDEPLPFPPHPSTRTTWRNLSVIFEGSESTNSLPNSTAQPQLDECPEESIVPTACSKPSKSRGLSIADKIAYFESASTSPLVESRRRSLPNILNPKSSSDIPFPTETSQTNNAVTDLGKKLHTGFLWYLNVHSPGPSTWVLCKASLYRTMLKLTWKSSGTTAATVILDLLNCLDICSTPTVSDPSIADDIGAIAWARHHHAVDDIYQMHLQFDDGVERIATSALIERVTWIGAILEFLPERPTRRVNPGPSPMGTSRIRPLNGHNRTRSTGDVPKDPGALTPISSKSSSTPNTKSGTRGKHFSVSSNSLISTNESSSLSSVPARRRSVSLKSLASLITRRSSRVDNLSSDGSETARSAPVSPTPSRLRLRPSSRSNLQDVNLATIEDVRSSGGQPMRKREPSKLRKLKPRIPTLTHLNISPHPALSNRDVPDVSQEETPVSFGIGLSADYSSGSAAYQIALSSLPSTPLYYTASEGEVGDESPSTSLQVSTSTPDDSLFVTASDITSSDAWMAQFSAASRLSSPRMHFRGRPRPRTSSPSSRTMSSGRSLFHLFDTPLAPPSTLKESGIISPISVVANAGSDIQGTTSMIDATSEDMDTIDPKSETSVIMVDRQSSVATNESPKLPPAPPPTPANAIHNHGPFDETTSRSQDHTSCSLYFHASQLETPDQTTTLGISTRFNLSDSLSDINNITFSSTNGGDVEHEMVRYSSPTQSKSSPLAPVIPLRPRGFITIRSIRPVSSDISLSSSIFFPSRQPSIHTVVPDTPSVEISDTPIEASRIPSIRTPKHTSASNVQSGDENSCQERLRYLLDFIERTRAAQTASSGVFGEQLGRIEEQLIDLGRLLDERIQTTRENESNRNIRKRKDSPTSTFAQQNPFAPCSPNVISLSPPLTAIYGETTNTSAELQATPDATTASTSVAPHLELKVTSGEDISSSLHLSRFPDVPRHAFLSVGASNDASSYPSEEVSNDTLHLQIESLGKAIGTLVTRQQAFNDALERLQRTGITLEPMSRRSGPGDNGLLWNISTILTSLLEDLEKIARRTAGTHQKLKRKTIQEILDLESTRTSPSSVGHAEILQAHPILFNATSIAYAEMLQRPKHRSMSLGSASSPLPDRLSPLIQAITHSETKSLDSVQQVLHEDAYNEYMEPRSAASLERDMLRPSVGIHHPPSPEAPITRTWHHNPKDKSPQMLPGVTPEPYPDISPSGNPEARPQPDIEGATRVARLLQRAQIQQEAACSQQDDVVRYLGELNDWLSRDAVDRCTELRDLGERLDEIQEILAHGPMPPILLDVPLVPMPKFMAPVDSDNGMSEEILSEDDDISTIIPPNPSKRQKPPATTVLQPDDDINNLLLSTTLPIADDFIDGKTVTITNQNPLAPPFSTHRPGTRVTFRSRSPDRSFTHNSHNGHTYEPLRPSIRVLWDTATFGPHAISSGAKRHKEWPRPQEPSYLEETELRSRSRVVKSLTPESSEIIVNIPGPSAQTAVRYNCRSPGKSHLPVSGIIQPITRLPLPTYSPKPRPPDHHPSSAGAKQRFNTSRPVSPNIQIKNPYTIPRTVFGYVPAESHNRRPSRSPHVPLRSPQRHRSRSKDIHHPETIIVRMNSPSPERMTRTQSYYHRVISDPQGNLECSSDRRIRGSNGNRDQNSHRNIYAPSIHSLSPRKEADLVAPYSHGHVISPVPLRALPVPSILTVPAISQPSQARVISNTVHPTEGINFVGVVTSPQDTYGRVPAPILVHSDIVSQEPKSSRDPKNISTAPLLHDNQLVRFPHNSVGNNVETVITNSQVKRHIARDLVSEEGPSSNPAASLLPITIQSHISKPRGARKRPIQQNATPDGPKVKLELTSPQTNLEERRKQSFAIDSESQQSMTQTGEQCISTPQLRPARPPPSREGNRKRQPDYVLSFISEKSEPKPSVPTSPITVVEGREVVDNSLKDLEYVCEDIFSAHQAERQRILEEEFYKQRLANQELLSYNQESMQRTIHQNETDTVVPQSLFGKRAREPAPTGIFSSAKGSPLSPKFKTSQRGSHLLDIPIVPTEENDLRVPKTKHWKSETAIHRTEDILPSLEIVKETPRSTSGPKRSGLFKPLGGDPIPGTGPNPLAQELTNERAKARRLEEEIQATKAAIQTIKDQKVAANERRSFETVQVVSSMQNEIKSQLQSIGHQLKADRVDQKESMQENTPLTSVEVDISGLVNRILQGQIAERRIRQEQRNAAEAHIALEAEIEQLQRQNEAQKILIGDMCKKTTKENRQQQEVLLDTFTQVSAEQVKFNVQERLHEFTGVMTNEVRVLLNEVGNLREQRRNLQHEVGCLLCFRRKMEPGGEFDASWDPMQGPPCTHFPLSDVKKDSRPAPNVPPFAGSVPVGGSNLPAAPRRPNKESHSGPLTDPVVIVTSPPPEYSVRRNNHRGQKLNGSTTVEPIPQAPPRAARKANGKRPN